MLAFVFWLGVLLVLLVSGCGATTVLLPALEQGAWCIAAMPSSRDDDFMARCRFATVEEAIDAARKGEQKHG